MYLQYCHFWSDVNSLTFHFSDWQVKRLLIDLAHEKQST